MKLCPFAEEASFSSRLLDTLASFEDKKQAFQSGA